MNARVPAVAIALILTVPGCNCGALPPSGDDGGPGDGGSSDGGGNSDAGSFDAGTDVPDRLQVSTSGSSAATSCQSLQVRSVGKTVAPVRAEVIVALDGGPWVDFFDATTCTGPTTHTVAIAAGTSSRELRVRIRAFGAHVIEASSATLDAGTATTTALADAVFSRDRAVLPALACSLAAEVRTVVPFSQTDVPAAAPSRFTLTTNLPFGGSSTDAGCQNSQFDVTVPEGSARGAVWAGSSGAAGTTAQLTLSPVVPAGVNFPATLSRVALFAQCLPAGEVCDGGACCGGACAAGVCP